MLWPIDRATIALVWGAGRLPVAPAPTATITATPPIATGPGGSTAPPTPTKRRSSRSRIDAADFVARVRERVAGGGTCVCALDTELFGHWWHEGLAWLRLVLAEARRQGLALTTLDEALARCRPVAATRPRSADHQLGRGRRPAHLERPRRGRSGLAGSHGRAAGGRRRRRGRPAVERAPCASCWRCSPLTGPSRPTGSWPASIRAAGRRPRGGAAGGAGRPRRVRAGAARLAPDLRLDALRHAPSGPVCSAGGDHKRGTMRPADDAATTTAENTVDVAGPVRFADRTGVSSEVRYRVLTRHTPCHRPDGSP